MFLHVKSQSMIWEGRSLNKEDLFHSNTLSCLRQWGWQRVLTAIMMMVISLHSLCKKNASGQRTHPTNWSGKHINGDSRLAQHHWRLRGQEYMPPSSLYEMTFICKNLYHGHAYDAAAPTTTNTDFAKSQLFLHTIQFRISLHMTLTFCCGEINSTE